jgi:hypothetical protein
MYHGLSGRGAFNTQKIFGEHSIARVLWLLKYEYDMREHTTDEGVMI